jgi:hypothetical protein
MKRREDRFERSRKGRAPWLLSRTKEELLVV